ncbi:MAG TPA: hypothetical protein VG817_09910 [Gemmatimonadales bacterium]|nr:hypothetical protein [Gemmatimonadales bacterium]
MNLDLPITNGRIRPTLLAGLDLSRLHSKRRYTVVDSTGTVISSSHFDGWATGLGAHVGAGVVLPAVGRLVPALEGRVYGFAVQDKLSWTVLPVLTAGLSVQW